MQKNAMWPESLDCVADTSQVKVAEEEGRGGHRKHRKVTSWWSWRNSLCWAVYWGRRMANWRQDFAKLLSSKYWGVGSLWVYIDVPGSCGQRSLVGMLVVSLLDGWPQQPGSSFLPWWPLAAQTNDWLNNIVLSWTLIWAPLLFLPSCHVPTCQPVLEHWDSTKWRNAFLCF